VPSRSSAPLGGLNWSTTASLQDRAWAQLGTSGSGNHFVEFGTLEVEGTQTPLEEGQGIFVPAGADHRFSGYEGLSVLVIFDRRR